MDLEIVEMLTFITGVVEPKFTPEHYGQLVEKSSGAIDKVQKEILGLSGASKEELDDLQFSFQV